MARILVIEDSEELRRLIERALTGAGHDVVLAEDGEAGIRAFREAPADLVITDIFMPEKDGLETLRILRREPVPFKTIAISGGGSLGHMDILRTARQMGADRILAKPFRFQDLKDLIVELLGA